MKRNLHRCSLALALVSVVIVSVSSEASMFTPEDLVFVSGERTVELIAPHSDLTLRSWAAHAEVTDRFGEVVLTEYQIEGMRVSKYSSISRVSKVLMERGRTQGGVVVGVTTMSEIDERFGPPTGVRTSGTRVEWYYFANQGMSLSFADSRFSPAHEYIVTFGFDKSDTLTDIHYELQLTF